MRKIILLVLIGLIGFACAASEPNVLPGVSYQTDDDVILSCKAMDSDGLNGVSLYSDTDGSWGLESFKTLNENEDSASWNFAGLSLGDYSFNCYACDVNGNCGFGSSNLSFEIDPLGGTTYYIREDGGNLTECNGIVDRGYDASFGMNQSCGLSDVFLLCLLS